MADLLEICSVDEPNLSREDLQGLQLVGRRGGKMMFRVGTGNVVSFSYIMFCYYILFVYL